MASPPPPPPPRFETESPLLPPQESVVDTPEPQLANEIEKALLEWETENELAKELPNVD